MDMSRQIPSTITTCASCMFFIELLNKYGLIDGYRRTYGPVKKYIEEHK